MTLILIEIKNFAADLMFRASFSDRMQCILKVLPGTHLDFFSKLSDNATHQNVKNSNKLKYIMIVNNNKAFCDK